MYDILYIRSHDNRIAYTFRAILVDFFALLSIFGHDSLSQSESPTSGGLGLVVLDVHCSGKDG